MDLTSNMAAIQPNLNKYLNTSDDYYLSSFYYRHFVVDAFKSLSKPNIFKIQKYFIRLCNFIEEREQKNKNTVCLMFAAVTTS